MPVSSLRLRLCVAAVLVLEVVGSRARAQSDTMPSYTLGEVVVSARNPAVEMSGTVRLVTAADIAACDAHTLDEALEAVPGVDVRVGGDGIPRIDVRGYRPRHLLLLLDGVPLNSTFDGQFDPTLIPAEDIAYIKVTLGPSSVLYGAGPLAGTIDVTTRRGAGPAAGTVRAEARQSGATLFAASAGAGGGRVTGFAAASAYRTDGYLTNGLPGVTGTGDALRGNSGRRRVTLFGDATWHPRADVTAGFAGAWAQGSYDIPTTAITDSTDPFATRPTYERVPVFQQGTAQLAVSYTPPGPLSVRGWGYANRYSEVHNRYDDGTYTAIMSDSTIKGSFRDSSRSLVTGLGLQATARVGPWGRVTLGLTGERDDWNAELSIRDVPVGGGGGGGGSSGSVYQVRTEHGARGLGQAGVALEYEVHPVPWLGAVAGYARNWLAKDSAGSQAGSSYSVGAYVDVTARTRLRVAASRRIRFPTVSQLYDPTAGNPALFPERATEYDAGIAQELPGRSRASLSAFTTDVEGYIQRPAPGAPYANFSAYRFRGIEVSAGTAVLRRLLVRGGYTLLDTEDRSPGAGFPALPYRPRHRATLEARYHVLRGSEAVVSATHVAGAVYSSRAGPAQQATLPAYTLVDLRLTERSWLRPATVYLGVGNLFDAAYEQEYGYPRIARTVYGGMEVRW